MRRNETNDSGPKKMNSPDFAGVLSEDCVLFFGAALIGGGIGHWVACRRKPEVSRVRRSLGRTLDRFAHVPSARLDTILLAADKAGKHGLEGVLSVLGVALWYGTLVMSSTLYRAWFPERPVWPGLVIAPLIAFGMSQLTCYLERRALLRRIAISLQSDSGPGLQ